MRNLNFGCTDQVVPGWVNTDITPHLLVALIPGAAWLVRRLGLMTAERYAQHGDGLFRRVRYLNLARPFPFPDGYFDNAFSANVLEHLYPEQARGCVCEVFRVLRPGGVFRVSVPDLEAAVHGFHARAPERFLDAAAVLARWIAWLLGAWFVPGGSRSVVLAAGALADGIATIALAGRERIFDRADRAGGG